jgi:hypothetical protein
MSAEDEIHAALLGILDAYHPAKEALHRKAFVPRVVRGFLTQRYRRKVAKTRKTELEPEDIHSEHWRAEFERQYADQFYNRWEPPRLLVELYDLYTHNIQTSAARVSRDSEREWSEMWQAKRAGLIYVRRIQERTDYDSGERYFLTPKGKFFAQSGRQLYRDHFRRWSA